MSESSTKRHVWIVSEGSPGHLSQTRGLLEAISNLQAVTSSVIETRPNMNGIVRQLARGWMGSKGKPLPRVAFGLLRCVDLPQGRPDLILSSGGKAVFAARSLAVRHHAPLIFIGERKPYPSSWFHSVFTPSPVEVEPNDVAIELVPTAVTPSLIRAEAAKWSNMPAGRLWAMIIGGSSSSHRYGNQDWLTLAAAMNTLAANYGIRWLLSTSRRTGAEAEEILRSALNPLHLGACVWWAANPEKCLLRFLGAAERVMVTQDSITMVTESVESGTPVIAIRPQTTSIGSSSYLESYYRRLESAGRILRLPISALSAHDPAAFIHQARTRTAAEEIAALLLKRLGWM